MCVTLTVLPICWKLFRVFPLAATPLPHTYKGDLRTPIPQHTHTHMPGLFLVNSFSCCIGVSVWVEDGAWGCTHVSEKKWRKTTNLPQSTRQITPWGMGYRCWHDVNYGWADAQIEGACVMCCTCVFASGTTALCTYTCMHVWRQLHACKHVSVLKGGLKQ